MLKSFVKLAQEGADHDDRTLAHLLSNPTNDGGQWQMLVNLIEKYGLIPLSQWPSPVLAENSSRLNTVLNNQVSYSFSLSPSLHLSLSPSLPLSFFLFLSLSLSLQLVLYIYIYIYIYIIRYNI